MTIDVYIKLTSGRVFHMPVPENETVRDLGEAVAKEEGVSGNCLRLKYTGKVLNKDHTMSYLGVRPETILKVDIIQVKSLTIHVKCPSGVTLALTIQNITTLKEILTRITEKQDKQGQANISAVNKLHMKGKPLNGDHINAQDLGIEDEAVLNLVEQAASAPSSASNIDQDVVEELDQATLDELLANFAVGFDSDKKIEVVFSFDTTGSMYASLTEVRAKLDTTVSRLLRDIPNIRIGIISHGDFCDQDTYVLRSVDLTSNVDDLLDYINNVPSTGGEGDSACYEWVMVKAQELSWSEDAAKALVIIGDVKPHAVSHTDQRINWHKELDKLCQKEVKVYGVQVRNYDPAEPFYREIAEKSGGAYIKFQHFNFLTDMFLAVCYREAGEEQLQQYAEEVKQEGRMTEELTDMFQQLEEKPSSSATETEKKSKGAEKQGPRYVSSSWWDPKLDDGANIYTYDAQQDSWSRIPFGNPAPSYMPVLGKPMSRLRKSLRRKRGNTKSCTVM